MKTNLLRFESLEDRQLLSVNPTDFGIEVVNLGAGEYADAVDDVVFDVASVTTLANASSVGTCAARAASDSSVYVGFNITASGVSYQVECSDNADFDGSTVKTYTQGMGTAKFSGLEADTTYFFRARAVDADGEGEWTDVATATTASYVDPVAVPTLSIVKAQDGYVNLRMSRSSLAESYTVECSTSPDFSNSTQIVYTQAGVAQITSLAKGATWYFRAKASTPGNPDTDWSETVSTYIEGVSSPTLTARASGTTSGYVSWTASEDAVSYQWQISTDPDFTDASMRVGIGYGNRAVSGLTADTTYFVRVRAVDESGAVSVWSDVASFTTIASEDLDTAPTLRATTKSDTRIAISLSRDAIAKNYVIEYSMDPSFPEGITQTKIHTQSGGYYFSGLRPETTYYFRAKGCTVEGDTPWSEVVSATTLPGDNFLEAPTLSARVSGASTAYVTVQSSASCASFVLESADNPYFTNAVEYGHVSSGTYAVSKLATGSVNYFRIKGFTADGETRYSQVVSIETFAENDLVSVPVLTVTRVASDKVYVLFSRETVAEKFVIQIATDAGFENVVATKTHTQAGQTTFSNLEANTTYYLRARCANRDNDSNNTLVYTDWSEVISFTTLDVLL